MDKAGIEELAASIKENGILQPILARPKAGRPGTYEIIGGERRWRAAQVAQLHEVPVLVRELGDREAMAAGLVENLQRQDLNAHGGGRGLPPPPRRVRPDAGIARPGGRAKAAATSPTPSACSPCRPRCATSCATPCSPPAMPRTLVTAKDPARLAAQIVARNLSVRQAEALAAAQSHPRPGKPERPGRDREIEALERQLIERLGLKVSVKAQGKGGEVVIHYRDLDQLDGSSACCSARADRGRIRRPQERCG